MVRTALALTLAGCTADSGIDVRPLLATSGDATSAPEGADPSLPGPVRASALPGWPAVVIDEVLPANDSIHPDERGEYDDYLELFNRTDLPVDLTGWSLGDDPDPDWTFPEGTVIPPRGHLLVWADGEPDQGPLHASFSLSPEAEGAWLFAPGGEVVDSLVWPDLPDDVVFARFPSGGVRRAASIVATPWNPSPADPGLSVDPSDALFPPGGVIRVELAVAEEDLDRLAANDELVVAAGIGFEGGWLAPVGLSIKGGLGSRRDIREKSAFRINLDEFVSGLRLRGMETVTLNNMVQDPSTMHELLAYPLLRESGVPASRVAHVELYLNGEYRGLYLHVETVDDQYLQRWFPQDPYGNLYEGVYGTDLRPSDVDNFDRDEQGANDVSDRSDLRSLAEFLAGPATEAQMPEFERRVDVESLLSAMAGEALLAHWDGYQYSSNNYRIYHEPAADRWTLIPSGLDQTFEDERGLWDGDAVLASFCLDIPSCRDRYDLRLAELSLRMLDFDCRGRIEATLPLTRPLYQRDPYKEDSVEEMDREIDATIAWCRDFPLDVLDRL